MHESSLYYFICKAFFIVLVSLKIVCSKSHFSDTKKNTAIIVVRQKNVCRKYQNSLIKINIHFVYKVEKT